MSNIKDEDEFDLTAEKMTLEGVVECITCPVLLAAGEFDELVPLGSTFRAFDRLRCPKEIWVYENENHVMGGRLPDFYPMMADWLKDKIEGRYTKDLAKRVFFEER